ncbi:MAG: hypothetical protein CMD96_05955 [Gammaproteobacteria bacterium]|nr:hypothetical protein [Gammaproteobacteria bacterium]|tara:strand:- start:393 stop:5834 length:5442 start_codon:yes stop_codon:yes gene_type:complete
MPLSVADIDAFLFDKKARDPIDAFLFGDIKKEEEEKTEEEKSIDDFLGFQPESIAEPVPIPDDQNVLPIPTSSGVATQNVSTSESVTPLPDEDEVSFTKDVIEPTAKDFAATVAKAGAGFVKGATIGAIDLETGEVGVPFGDVIFQTDNNLRELLTEVGASDEIVNNEWIGMPMEMLGTIAPWSVVSKAISFLVGAPKSLRAANGLKEIMKGVGKRAGIEATAGGVVGGAKPIDTPEKTTPDILEGIVDLDEVKQESRLENILTTAAVGAGFSLIADSIHAIVVKSGISKTGQFDKLRKELSELFFGSGKVSKQAADDLADTAINNVVNKAGGFENLSKGVIKNARTIVKEAKAGKRTQPKLEGKAEEPTPEGDFLVLKKLKEESAIAKKIKAEAKPTLTESKTEVTIDDETTITEVKSTKSPDLKIVKKAHIQELKQKEIETLSKKHNVSQAEVIHLGKEHIEAIEESDLGLPDEAFQTTFDSVDTILDIKGKPLSELTPKEKIQFEQEQKENVQLFKQAEKEAAEIGIVFEGDKLIVGKKEIAKIIPFKKDIRSKTLTDVQKKAGILKATSHFKNLTNKLKGKKTKVVRNDGIKSLAKTNKGVISLNIKAIVDDFHNDMAYLDGKGKGLLEATSAQKKEVFKNIDIPALKKQIGTVEKYEEFIFWHEAAHIANKDATKYPRKKGKIDLSHPDAITIERIANKFAAQKMGFELPERDLTPEELKAAEKKARELVANERQGTPAIDREPPIVTNPDGSVQLNSLASGITSLNPKKIILPVGNVFHNFFAKGQPRIGSREYDISRIAAENYVKDGHIGAFFAKQTAETIDKGMPDKEKRTNASSMFDNRLEVITDGKVYNKKQAEITPKKEDYKTKEEHLNAIRLWASAVSTHTKGTLRRAFNQDKLTLGTKKIKVRGKEKVIPKPIPAKLFKQIEEMIDLKNSFYSEAEAKFIEEMRTITEAYRERFKEANIEGFKFEEAYFSHIIIHTKSPKGDTVRVGFDEGADLRTGGETIIKERKRNKFGNTLSLDGLEAQGYTVMRDVRDVFAQYVYQAEEVLAAKAFGDSLLNAKISPTAKQREKIFNENKLRKKQGKKELTEEEIRKDFSDPLVVTAEFLEAKNIETTESSLKIHQLRAIHDMEMLNWSQGTGLKKFKGKMYIHEDAWHNIDNVIKRGNQQADIMNKLDTARFFIKRILLFNPLIHGFNVESGAIMAMGHRWFIDRLPSLLTANQIKALKSPLGKMTEQELNAVMLEMLQNKMVLEGLYDSNQAIKSDTFKVKLIQDKGFKAAMNRLVTNPIKVAGQLGNTILWDKWVKTVQMQIYITLRNRFMTDGFPIRHIPKQFRDHENVKNIIKKYPVSAVVLKPIDVLVHGELPIVGGKLGRRAMSKADAGLAAAVMASDITGILPITFFTRKQRFILNQLLLARNWNTGLFRSLTGALGTVHNTEYGKFIPKPLRIEGFSDEQLRSIGREYRWFLLRGLVYAVTFANAAQYLWLDKYHHAEREELNKRLDELQKRKTSAGKDQLAKDVEIRIIKARLESITPHPTWKNEAGHWLDIDTGIKDSKGGNIYLRSWLFRAIHDYAKLAMFEPLNYITPKAEPLMKLLGSLIFNHTPQGMVIIAKGMTAPEKAEKYARFITESITPFDTFLGREDQVRTWLETLIVFTGTHTVSGAKVGSTIPAVRNFLSEYVKEYKPRIQHMSDVDRKAMNLKFRQGDVEGAIDVFLNSEVVGLESLLNQAAKVDNTLGEIVKTSAFFEYLIVKDKTHPEEVKEFLKGLGVEYYKNLGTPEEFRFTNESEVKAQRNPDGTIKF